MNIQEKIIKLLKDQPMGELAIIKFIPEELPRDISKSIVSLLINNRLIYDGHDYSMAPVSSKYGNRITVVDGVKFDSKLEANRWCELKILVKAGEITDLERQIPFIVSDAVRWGDKTLKAIKYVCDFKYTDKATGRKVVEDSKGKTTRLYILKRSLFVNRYPEYWFREIKK